MIDFNEKIREECNKALQTMKIIFIIIFSGIVSAQSVVTFNIDGVDVWGSVNHMQ